MKLRQHWFSAIMSAIVFVFLFLPIVVVFRDAFNANKTLLTWGGFTFKWFAEALSGERFQNAFVMSLTIAIIVMLLSMIFASLGAIGMAKLPAKVRTFYESAIFLRITLPEIVIVVGLFIVARMFGLKLGPAWVVIAQTLIYSAYAAVTINARLANVSSLYEKAAMDLGASQTRIIWTITLPLLAPSIFVGGLLAFTFSLDSVVSPTFLGGPSAETIPLLIMGMIKKGVSAEVNAIGVIMSVFNILVLLIVVRFIGIRQVAGSAVKGS
ncbi:ABC transporter permease [Bifidobacterium biavatii]|uniref:Spermidine/putrescine ABC superfamily ATP binding cassette transporter, membrane protein n=1 Tax=Bifidobacterium biavatii DSM 23969 TaxID=1437608 RepID=A0A087A1S9_9BIFI|nr:ABC transporter permease [Bifidobacterium biavatii]KFI52729.1 spermidine/putrescine ABC superfamily ATP binding cassette transporter, membrane protein [Bifidobacterium biavatii DSM 23969]